MLGLKKKVGVEVSPGAADANEEARRARNGVRPIGPAEDLARRELATLAHGTGYIEPDDLAKGFAPSVPKFDEALEDEVIRNGWFREKPSKATSRWVIRGTIALVLGVAGLVGGLNLPSSGLTLIGGAALAGGIALIVLARWMPAVSIPGSMIRAMLAAYRRTLEKTMALSQVDGRGRREGEPGVAADAGPGRRLGHRAGAREGDRGRPRAEHRRRLEGRGARLVDVLPGLVRGQRRLAGGSSAFGEGGGGLFSSSGVPDIGGMMASLSTIGTPPGGSGGGGGGFGGGGSGGGGGGSGGGF